MSSGLGRLGEVPYLESPARPELGFAVSRQATRDLEDFNENVYFLVLESIVRPSDHDGADM